MTLKNFLNYCKYSGVWVSFALNPYHWTVGGSYQTPTDMDPAYYGFFVSFGPLNIRAVLDNGSW
jgi:hypothetical protein